MDHPDTPESGEAVPAPPTPTAVDPVVDHPQQGGAWVRLPDGTLVREAYTRDQADTEE